MTTFAAFLLLQWRNHGEQHANIAVHTMLETAGAVVAMFAAGFLLARDDFRTVTHTEWMAAALLAGGVMDLAHAVVPIGPAFFWSRGLPTLAGGLLSAMVWFSAPLRRAGAGRGVAIFVAVIAVPVAICFVLFPNAWPAMFAEDGSYTVAAKAINVVGGIGFFVAAPYFLRRYRTLHSMEDLAFANQCILFGIAGVIFSVARLWNPAWWLLHTLRLAACIAVVAYVVDAHRQMGNRLREQLSIELDEQIQEIARLQREAKS